MSNKEEKWPVDIFRYSTTRGWELYQLPQTTQLTYNTTAISNNSEGVKKAKTGKNVRSMLKPSANVDANDDEGIVTVTPRYGCVEVKKLRLRIHLFEKHSNNGTKDTASAKEEGGTTNNSGDTFVKVNTTVIRRQDRILLSSRNGLGAVVLKFRSLNECMTFTDRLIELNKNYTFNQVDDKADQLKRPYQCRHNQFQVAKRVKLNCNHQHQQEKDDLQQVGKSDQRIQCSSQSSLKESEANLVHNGDDNIRSYIVRLLHDRDFLSFVDTIEKSLESTPDCSQILKAFEYPRCHSNTE